MVQDIRKRERFRCLYPIDLIPKSLPNRWSVIIVNQDTSEQKGSHWGVLHYTSYAIVAHYDSVGKQPKIVVHNLFLSQDMTYMYNNKRLQSYNTDTCGLFCLYYSYYSCRGVDFNSILKHFSDNLFDNEILVSRFFVKRFHKVYINLSFYVSIYNFVMNSVLYKLI